MVQNRNEKVDEPKSEMSDNSSAVSANDNRNVPSRLPSRCYCSFTREKRL